MTHRCIGTSKNRPCTNTVDTADGWCGRCRGPQHDQRIAELAAEARRRLDNRGRGRLARLFAA